MATDTHNQIISLVKSHRENLASNPQLMTVEESYLQDYERYISDLERETGQTLERFRIPQTAIQTRSGYRFCPKTYYLGQLDALLIYLESSLKSSAEWPSDIVD